MIGGNIKYNQFQKIYCENKCTLLIFSSLNLIMPLNRNHGDTLNFISLYVHVFTQNISVLFALYQS